MQRAEAPNDGRMNKEMMTRLAGALLVGGLVLSPGLSLADESAPSLEEVVVTMADTPEKHAALAHYYQGKAAEARSEAKRHETMGLAYGGGRLSERQRMKRHCQNMREKYTGIAEDYDALAKVHEEEAKKSK